MVVIEQTNISLSLSESIRNKLSKKPLQLEDKIISRAKKILSTKIDFVVGKHQYSESLIKLKAKYGILKLKNNSMQDKNEIQKTKLDGIPLAKHIIFPSENIELTWSNQFKVIGSGLANLGNTCYLNSTLQCLTYTPPLANYVIKYSHCEKCKIQGFCMICEMCKHIKFSLSKVYNVYKPLNILRNLKSIAKHFNPYKQEDAHEFFIHVIEALHISGINGYTKLDRYSKQTTLINQIFGGFLRSRVICKACHQPSDCYDPYVDISLDVKGNFNIQHALRRFVSPELIQNDNAYKCEKCKVKVPAIKQVTIHKLSNVCVFHLKRFTSSGHKINHFVEYPEKLNMTPYVSNEKQQGPPITYQLYAVLVHSGHSTNYGHYYCFCKGQNGFWYRLDDANVAQIPLKTVLSQEAYILFYIAEQKRIDTGNAIPQQNSASLPKPTSVTNPVQCLQVQKQLAHPDRSSVPATPIYQKYKPALVPYPDSPGHASRGASSGSGSSTSGNYQREIGPNSAPTTNVGSQQRKYSPTSVGISRFGGAQGKISFSLKQRFQHLSSPSTALSSRPGVRGLDANRSKAEPLSIIKDATVDSNAISTVDPNRSRPGALGLNSEAGSVIRLPDPPSPNITATSPNVAATDATQTQTVPLNSDGDSVLRGSTSVAQDGTVSPLERNTDSSGEKGSKRKKKHRHRHRKHRKRDRSPEGREGGNGKGVGQEPPSPRSKVVDHGSTNDSFNDSKFPILSPLKSMTKDENSHPSSSGASLYSFPYRKNGNNACGSSFASNGTPNVASTGPNDINAYPDTPSDPKSNGLPIVAKISPFAGDSTPTKSDKLKAYLNDQSAQSLFGSKVKTWEDTIPTTLIPKLPFNPVQRGCYTNGFSFASPSKQNKSSKNNTFKANGQALKSPFQAFIDYKKGSTFSCQAMEDGRRKDV